MANKFQKSVLERLEQETSRQKKQTHTGTKKPPVAAEKTEEIPQAAPVMETPEPVAEAVSAPEAPKPEPAPETPQVGVPPEPEPAAVQGGSLIDAYIRREPQRTAKNKTFYLDADVIKAVKAAARSNGITDSKLVNDVLRKVLGLDR